MIQKQLTPDLLCRVCALLKTESPLVLNVTNWVAMQTTANVLLAVGASPMMAHAAEELAELVGLSRAVVLNMGTLDGTWVRASQIAAEQARAQKIPIVFDPVGAGASEFRTQTARDVLARGVQVLRGNASEIFSLVNPGTYTKGVDSRYSSDAALEAALSLTKTYDCTVVVSGQTDIICAPHAIVYLSYGNPMLTAVTAMGCSATAMIAAFLALEENPALACTYAMACLGMSAERAVKEASGPGTFYPKLLDALFHFTKTPPRHFNHRIIER